MSGTPAGLFSMAGFDTSKRRSPGWKAMRMRTVRSSRVTTSRSGNAAIRAMTRCRPSMRMRLPREREPSLSLTSGLCQAIR